MRPCDKFQPTDYEETNVYDFQAWLIVNANGQYWFLTSSQYKEPSFPSIILVSETSDWLTLCTPCYFSLSNLSKLSLPQDT